MHELKTEKVKTRICSSETKQKSGSQKALDASDKVENLLYVYVMDEWWD